MVNVGYDGSAMQIVTAIGTAATPHIYTISAGAYVDSTYDSIRPSNYGMRYKNSLAKLSTAASNTTISAAGTALTIKGVTCKGVLANLYLNSIWIYEMDGKNQ